MLDRGTSAVRQREVYSRSRDMSQVVDSLVAEMLSGSPQSLPDDSLVGGTVVHGDPLPGE
jgi:hypothetical protein